MKMLHNAVLIEIVPLTSQVTSPVQWETTVKTLLDKGLKKSYELGPGKVKLNFLSLPSPQISNY